MLNIIIGALLIMLSMTDQSLARGDDPNNEAVKLLGELKTHGQEFSGHTESLTEFIAQTPDIIEISLPPMAVLRQSAADIVRRSTTALTVPIEPAAIQFALTMIKVDVGLGRSSLTRLKLVLLDRPITAEARTEIASIQAVLDVMYRKLGGPNDTHGVRK